MKKKCLLISSPNSGRLLPRGLAEIASFLQSRGCPTELLPLSYYLGPLVSLSSISGREEETASILKKAIRSINPVVIGISNQLTQDYPDCLKVLEICKRINHKIITVIGGPHVSFLDSTCMESPFVDVVVRGEGEWTMLDLLSAIDKGRGLESVKGITFKRNSGFLRTAERPLGDLKELPPLNFGLLPQDFVKNSFVYGMLNRGCLYNCKFCAEKVFWKKRRSFPTQRLIDEMKILNNKYKNRMVAVEDSMLHVGSEQFFEICRTLVKQKIQISPYFYIQSRVDTLTDDGIKALKKANINKIWLGVESFSPKVLKMMNKNISFKQIMTACEKLKKNNIETYAYLVVAHPGDDAKEATYTLEMIKHLLNKALISGFKEALFIPFPGTVFFSQPENFGIEILSYDWSKWQGYCDKPICQLRNFSAKQISDIYKRAIAIIAAYVTINRHLSNKKNNQLN